jgi:hypothetical protein
MSRGEVDEVPEPGVPAEPVLGGIGAGVDRDAPSAGGRAVGLEPGRACGGVLGRMAGGLLGRPADPEPKEDPPDGRDAPLEGRGAPLEGRGALDPREP